MNTMSAESPCYSCQHCKEEQVEMFLYECECEMGSPDDVFGSKHGCWKYEKRKEK